MIRVGVQLVEAEQSWRKVWETWASLVDEEAALPVVGSNSEVAERRLLLHAARSVLVSRAWRKVEQPGEMPLSGM